MITLDAENANAFFNRGCCFDSIGDIDRAITDYSKALELDMRASAQLQPGETSQSLDNQS